MKLREQYEKETTFDSTVEIDTEYGPLFVKFSEKYVEWLESLNVKLSDDLSKLTEENATLRAENERLKTLLHQVHHTLYWHGKVDVDTDLHYRIAKELKINQRVP